MALIYDLVDMQEIQGFARNIQRERDQNRFTLSAILPNNNIDDIEYRFTRGELADEDVAPIRAWDAESAIGGRQGVERIMGELPPISKKIPLTEEQRLRKRKLETGDTSAIEAAIFGDAAKMTRSVIARVEQLRGEALWNAFLDINENGVIQPVDFGRTSTHDAAANTLVGTAKWSDYAHSDPVGNLTAWVQTYVDTNGVEPAVIVASKTIKNHLLRNDQFRSYLSSIAGGPDLVTQAQIAQILAAFDLPPMVTYDTVVRVNGTQTRVSPVDQILFLPPSDEPLGATFFGTTAEALELVEATQVEANQAPGLTVVIDKEFDPVKTWTKAVAIALPVLANPDLTFVADVI